MTADAPAGRPYQLEVGRLAEATVPKKDGRLGKASLPIIFDITDALARRPYQLFLTSPTPWQRVPTGTQGVTAP
jgi:hypothetical protein